MRAVVNQLPTYTRYRIGYARGPVWVYTAEGPTIEDARYRLGLAIFSKAQLHERQKLAEELQTLTYLEQVTKGLVCETDFV